MGASFPIRVGETRSKDCMSKCYTVCWPTTYSLACWQRFGGRASRMRSEIFGEKEPIEGGQKTAKRRRHRPGPHADSPKDTEGVLQMDGTCCYLNGGLEAEPLTTSLRLHCRQMRWLEDWMLDFRYRKISWTSKPHRCGMELDERRRIAARKANH